LLCNCAFEYSETEQYIVMASDGKSKILNLTTETWLDGPNPLYNDVGRSLQYENTFLIVGGTTDGVRPFLLL